MKISGKSSESSSFLDRRRDSGGDGEKVVKDSLSAVPEDVLAGVQLQTARAARLVLDRAGDAHFGLRKQRKC